MKTWKTDHNRWRLASEGAEADLDEAIQAKARELSYMSRVTYVEANLMRHLRKEKPSQLEANAINEYIEKYDEVASDDILPWLYDTATRLFARFPPMRKQDGHIVAIPKSEMKWQPKAEVKSRGD